MQKPLIIMGISGASGASGGAPVSLEYSWHSVPVPVPMPVPVAVPVATNPQ